MQKLIATALSSILLLPSIVCAAEPATQTVFSDIQTGAWYENSALHFASLGYFANPKPLADIKLVGTPVFTTPSNHFLPDHAVVRSELVSLTVQMLGGILSPSPITATFDDVKVTNPAFGYFEEAVNKGWTKGKDSCAGTHPCYAFPDAKLTRGEAAAFIVSSFALTPTGTGKRFDDNVQGAWYYDAVQTLVDRCVLRGDDNTPTVRPLSTLNRAEMAVMLDRAKLPGIYGRDCGIIARPAYIKSVIRSAPAMLEMQASLLLKKSSATNISNYQIVSNRLSSASIKVLVAKLIGPMTVQLTLDHDLPDDGSLYTLTVSNLETNRNVMLNDQMSFERVLN